MSIQDILAGPCGRTFWASIRGGKLETGNDVTLFSRHVDEDLTFDIGNNAVLMNVDLKGTMRNFISYGETYPVDHWLQGVWCQKHYQHTKDLFYKVKIGDSTYTLDYLVGGYKTSLLGNVLPVTEVSFDPALEVKLISFAPISEDGSLRPRAGIYGLLLKNVSDEKIEGAVCPPEGNDKITIRAADGIEVKPEIEYEIGPGEVYWLPLVIGAVPAGEAFEQITTRSSEDWLRSTLAYFEGLTGKLDMPQDVYAGEFLQRCIHQCFNATVTGPSGEIAGENSWGSYPLRDEIWMKDFHYTLMPLVMTDSDLARKAIKWFLKWSVRYSGRLPGGIEHSISNSLAPVAMAGQYYACTGDKRFFLDNLQACERLKWLVEGAMELKVGDTNLLSSKYISDGGSIGDYHTGSNIFAWYCLTSFARVTEEVLGDAASAERYRKAAEGIRKDLYEHNIIDGPFGKQFIEGINADGKLPMYARFIRGVEPKGEIPYMAHDGEESDTTLASFYGFTGYDDPVVHNHKKFCLSEHNVIYTKDLGGVLWGDLGSYSTTFPAYVSGVAAARDAETMSGPEGYLTRIKKLTDLDGSVWWWPYAQWKTSYRIADQPARGLGKCGWASGVFCCLFISQVLGVSYDAPAQTFDFRPFSPSSDFTWDGFRIGSGVFDASLKREDSAVTLQVANRNSHPVTVRYRAILPEGKSAESISLRGKPYEGEVSTERFFESEVVMVEVSLEPGETGAFRVEF